MTRHRGNSVHSSKNFIQTSNQTIVAQRQNWTFTSAIYLILPPFLTEHRDGDQTNRTKMDGSYGLNTLEIATLKSFTSRQSIYIWLVQSHTVCNNTNSWTMERHLVNSQQFPSPPLPSPGSVGTFIVASVILWKPTSKLFFLLLAVEMAG